MLHLLYELELDAESMAGVLLLNGLIVSGSAVCSFTAAPNVFDRYKKEPKSRAALSAPTLRHSHRGSAGFIKRHSVFFSAATKQPAAFQHGWSRSFTLKCHCVRSVRVVEPVCCSDLTSGIMRHLMLESHIYSVNDGWQIFMRSLVLCPDLMRLLLLCYWTAHRNSSPNNFF